MFSIPISPSPDQFTYSVSCLRLINRPARHPEVLLQASDRRVFIDPPRPSTPCQCRAQASLRLLFFYLGVRDDNDSDTEVDARDSQTDAGANVCRIGRREAERHLCRRRKDGIDFMLRIRRTSTRCVIAAITGYKYSANPRLTSSQNLSCNLPRAG